MYAIGRESLEWFAPGQRNGVIVKAPEGLSMEHSYAKFGERVLYLASENQITKIDGDKIERLPLPPQTAKKYNANIDVTDDGTLWYARDGDALFRRKTGGDWEQVAVPGAKPDVHDIVARGNRVWIAAKSSSDGVVVAWNGPKPAQVAKINLPDVGFSDFQIATTNLERPKPAAKGCNSVFALFYGITKYAGPGYDFPKTREALKGRTQFSSARFVKTKVRDQEYFGAFAKDLAQGRQLIALIAKNVEGSTPQLLCHKPHVVAELGIDLATGSSSGWTPVK